MKKLTPEAIKVVRQTLGWTQGQLARRADMQTPLISAIEREDRPLLPHYERKILKALGLTSDLIEETMKLNRKLKEAAGGKMFTD